MKKVMLSFLLFFCTFNSLDARVNSVLSAKGNKISENKDKINYSKKHNGSNKLVLDSQQKIIKAAVKLAKADGFKKPKILGAIIVQESKAGTASLFRTANHKKSYDKTVGLGQIKASTARYVLQTYPNLIKQFKINSSQLKSNKYLLNRLGFDDKFNLAIASKYLIMLYKIKPNINWVIAAYNMGPGNAQHVKHPENVKYVKLVNSHLPVVKNALSI